MIALILGGARSVWDELDVAKAMVGPPHLVVAANYAGILYRGRLDGWATVHHEQFDMWRRERRVLGRNDDYRAFIHETGVASDAQSVNPWARCSSGLFAAQCAIECMGATGAILCGVPLDDTGSHIHHGGEWKHRHFYIEGFEAVARQGKPIRSMSGWSRDLFGAPDAAWIAACR